MTERKKALTNQDLGNYALVVPEALPGSKGPKPTPLSAIRAALNQLYNGSAILRQQLTSQTNVTAWSGSIHWDRGFAAATLLKHIVDAQVPGMEGVEKPLAMIRHHLPTVLKEHEIDRQSLIRQAITDGRKAREAAAQAEAEADAAQAAVAAE